jgi:hypothetical protein
MLPVNKEQFEMLTDGNVVAFRGRILGSAWLPPSLLRTIWAFSIYCGGSFDRIIALRPRTAMTDGRDH